MFVRCSSDPVCSQLAPKCFRSQAGTWIRRLGVSVRHLVRPDEMQRLEWLLIDWVGSVALTYIHTAIDLAHLIGSIDSYGMTSIRTSLHICLAWLICMI